MEKVSLPELLKDIATDEETLAELSSILLAGYTPEELVAELLRWVIASQHDVLTRVFNRKTIFVKAERALQYAYHAATHLDPDKGRKGPSEVAILIVDIDHFKEKNTRYGHPGADLILRAVAQKMQDTVRLTDLVGRYGGEEFMIILVGTNREGAFAAAENVRKAIEKGEFTPDGDITVSIGVALSTTTYKRNALIELADAAMLAAKKAGRNRTYIV